MMTGWLEKAREVERRALVSGALQPIETRAEHVRVDSIEFAIRVVSSLACKPMAFQPEDRGPRSDSTSPPKPPNPFLPYDPDLYVCDVPPRHVCLLNKFQVVATHVLLVTRQFERQESALDEGDFAALASCLGEADGLGFYNSARVAGASQLHKHLQIVPFLDSDEPGFPLLTVWESSAEVALRVRQAPLPFPHALERLELPWDDPPTAGRALCEAYRRLLDYLQRGDPAQVDPLPYNLLVTRRWMFAVPRTREKSEGISLNALAFAGGLLVHDALQLARVRRRGPLAMLAEVTGPTAAESFPGPESDEEFQEDS
jgi:sulfate adenylyltransferase (ADP) / ATP adenylyltransferase